jgi:hypothetical protein
MQVEWRCEGARHRSCRDGVDISTFFDAKWSFISILFAQSPGSRGILGKA